MSEFLKHNENNTSHELGRVGLANIGESERSIRTEGREDPYIDIIMLAPEEKKKFIEIRKAELTKNQDKTISDKKTIIDGLFDENTEIKSSIDPETYFKIDDDKIYEDAIDWLQRIDSTDDFRNDEARMYAAQYATTLYFNSLRPETNGVPRVSEHHSVRENKEYAGTAERAAVYHNILLFLGMESHYINGSYFGGDGKNPFSEQYESPLGRMMWQRFQSERPYQFVLTTSVNGTYYVVDPTKPRLTYENDGQIRSIAPLTIRTGQKELPVKGSKFSVEAENYEIDENGNRKPYMHKKYNYRIGSPEFHSR